MPRDIRIFYGDNILIVQGKIKREVQIQERKPLRATTAFNKTIRYGGSQENEYSATYGVFVLKHLLSNTASNA